MQLAEAIELVQNDYFQNQDKPTVWADLGCGSGLFTKALGHFLKPGSIIYAIDKKNPLKREKINGVEIIPLQSDFIKDELQIKNLDGILMANSLHYVKNKSLFLEKCKSYLKDHVYFLIVEYDTNIPVAQWVPYPVNFSSLKGLFEEMEFLTSLKLGERPSLYGRNVIYAALFSK